MIVVDIETSGLNPRENSIISIGAVDFDNPENCFYGECRLRDGAKITGTLAVNGFTVDGINNANKSCLELLKEFLEWSKKIYNRTIAGHNVRFDFNFLYEHFIFYNLVWPFGYRIVDLHSVFYFYLVRTGKEIILENNISAISLDTIIDYLKLPKRTGFHNALEDARLTYQAFSILLKK